MGRPARPPQAPRPPSPASPHLNLIGMVFNFKKNCSCGSFFFSVADFFFSDEVFYRNRLKTQMNAMNYIAKMKYGKLSRDPNLFV
jgi:hypothetical protein